MVLPKLDPALGVLDRVSWIVSANVEGSASFENLDAAAATITTLLQARITLSRPDLSPLQVVLPVVNNTDSAAAFGGSIDFAGTSGKSCTGLTASDSSSSFSVAPADLAAVTAASIGETTLLPVTAVGDSGGTGAGDLLLLFQTFAASQIRVEHEYHQVPAPAAAGVLGLGGLMAARRRRR
jgi:hypothetical protein